MRAEIARLVFPVLTTGLLRKQELIGGVALDLAEVQKELAGLLQATSQTEAWVHPGRFGKDFLGIQYALACWLDEIFISEDSPWRVPWADRALELELFETRNRAWMFWQQSGHARKLAEPDALEVYYLCVVLGFRGIVRDDQGTGTRDFPDAPQNGDVKGWCDEIKEQLDNARAPENLLPVEKQPVTSVPELHGAARFQTLMFVVAVCLLVVAPIVGVLIGLLPIMVNRWTK
jgi:type VI secretion system protein ImpK